MNTQAACFAGFQVAAQQGTGAVTLQPLVQGSPAGTVYTTNPAYQYTLRVRVHCAEIERELAFYRSFGDSGAITAGGESIAASGNVQMEIQQFVDGVGGMPVTLYDGAVVNLPAVCNVVAASSVNLIAVSYTHLDVYKRQGLGVDLDLGTTMVAEQCEIIYQTCGTQSFGGLDRGRALSAMDEELVAMAQPFYTPKLDYTATPPASMLTKVFWNEPGFRCV